MKILSAAQIKEADKFTIVNEPVSSVLLMERAATKCVNYIIEKFPDHKQFCIVCGPGNNGGDGLAIARLLWHYQKSVEVYFCNVNNSFSEDFILNKNRLIKETDVSPKELNDQNLNIVFNEESILIDCIFGNGLSRPLEGWIAQLVNEINQLNCLKIAIDLPSGLMADDTSYLNGKESILKADYTLTFQLPKLSLLLPEGIYYGGHVEVLDIGLDEKYIQEAKSDFFYVTKDIAGSLIKERPLAGHKGVFGHAYLLCGSAGKAGAAALCAKAALKSGCGLVTVETAIVNYASILSVVPEAMLQTVGNDGSVSTINLPANTRAVGIGPGIGNTKESEQLLKLLLNKWSGPMVLDADALNVLADNKTLMAYLPAGTVLTPHPGEFDRLFNLKNPLGIEQLKAQIEASKKHNIFIVLKGYRTSISTPKGRVYFNSTGNNGMATAGSGDVLTGIITSFLAQGYYPLEACILGVYLHGLAGDLALSKESAESLIASDIISYLGSAFKSFK